MIRFRPPTLFVPPARPCLARAWRAPRWAALGVLLTAGCAQAPVIEQPLPPPLPEPAPSVLGVAVVEPASDVADLTEAVRHVVGPAGVIGVATARQVPSRPAANMLEEVSTSVARTPTVAESAEPPVARSGSVGDGNPPPGARSVPGSEMPRGPSAEDPAALDSPSAGAEPLTPVGAPNGSATPTADSDTEASPRNPAAGHAEPEPVLEPGTAPQDAILAAWELYCVTTDLTPEQWGIIDRTAMPAALEGQWAARCRPEK